MDCRQGPGKSCSKATCTTTTREGRKKSENQPVGRAIVVGRQAGETSSINKAESRVQPGGVRGRQAWGKVNHG